jgi:hypothetical protein
MQGIDILDQVEKVKMLFVKYDAQAIGSDKGCGVLQGQLLQKEFGYDKVFMVNYVTAKRPLRYDQEGIYFAADRTMAMDGIVMKIKIGRERFETPAWSVMATYYDDALAIFEEESQAGRRLYRHLDTTPDDWFHSIVFGDTAFKVLNGDYTYLDDPVDYK